MLWEWIRSLACSRWTYWGLTRMERCTSCTNYSPYRLTSNQKPGISSTSREICPTPPPPPLPGSRTACGILRGEKLHARRFTSISRDPPGGILTTRLEVDELRSGGEAIDGRPRLGVTGVDLCPPDLRYLATREEKNLNIEATRKDLPPPADRLGAPLRGGTQLVAVFLYRGPNG